MSTAFSHKEQLCGLENLRLWSDAYGSDGSLLATIHYSAKFSPGYLAFRLCGPSKTVQVKDEGEKWVDIRGLEVSPAAEGTDMKAFWRTKSSTDASKSPKLKKEKIITGVRMEFDKASDQVRFLQVCGVSPSIKVEDTSRKKSNEHFLKSLFKE